MKSVFILASFYFILLFFFGRAFSLFRLGCSLLMHSPVDVQFVIKKTNYFSICKLLQILKWYTSPPEQKRGREKKSNCNNLTDMNERMTHVERAKYVNVNAQSLFTLFKLQKYNALRNAFGTHTCTQCTQMNTILKWYPSANFGPNEKWTRKTKWYDVPPQNENKCMQTTFEAFTMCSQYVRKVFEYMYVCVCSILYFASACKSFFHVFFLFCFF